MLTSFDDIDRLSRHAADLFRDIAARSIAERGSFFVALAGGSTPKALYALLSESPYSGDIAWDRIEIFFGDERWVPLDHPESNFAAAQIILLSKVPLISSQVHPVPTTAPSLREAALAYEDTIRARFSHAREAAGIEEAEPVPRFDLILLGMGPDGHTASLFPHSRQLSVTGRLVSEGDAPGTPVPKRISMTLPLINAARNVVFMVAGSDKASALAEVFSASSSGEDFPAKQVQPVNGELLWLVSGIPSDQGNALQASG